MPSIFINTFEVYKIEPVLYGRPAPYGREYLSFGIKFNIEKPSSLVAFQLFDNRNKRITNQKKFVYHKDEMLIIEGYQLETQQQYLNPTTLTAWLVDGNNQRISDIATRVLNIHSFKRFTIPFSSEKEALAPAEPTVVSGVKPFEKPERVSVFQPAVTEPTVVSGVKPFEKPERVSVFQPKKILSPQIKKIIDEWSVKKIIVPAWFANNNMNWVLEGRITEQEFLDAYTNLVNTGVITSTTPQVTIAPLPEITLPSIPEVSAVMELTTTNFQVKLDNKIQFSSSLSNADYLRLHDEMHYEKRIRLVFLNETDFKPLSNFSKILRQIQNLLRDQVVETVTISPTGQVMTAPEPTVAGKTGLMGAGVLGLIGILMLGGFIADHVRKRK